MAIRNLLTAAAMAVACLPAGPLLAQSAPAPETATPPAPAASPVPAATPAPSPTAVAPATPSTSPAADKGEGKAAASVEPAKPKAPKQIRISAQTRHEIAHSLKTGTVPSRYRSQIPKEYQKYIPFER